MTHLFRPTAAILLVALLNAWYAPSCVAELIGHWKLDEGAGDIANDSSPSGTQGMITNADTGGLGPNGSVWVNDPERGTVAGFNGTLESAYVRVGNIPVMTLEQDFTWAFWGNHHPDNTDPNNVIFGNRYESGTTDFAPRQFIKFTPDRFEYHMNGNANDDLQYDDLSLTAGAWLHHAVVKDGPMITYYRDGEAIDSKEITQALTFEMPLYLGGVDAGDAGENWQGMMSDARIYDEALSAGDVMSCFLGACPGDGAPGDVDGDGDADRDDFDIISGNMGLSPATRPQGDLRNPDEVGLEDFRAWKNGAFAEQVSASQVNVPEPTGIALALASLAILGCRRRRRT